MFEKIIAYGCSHTFGHGLINPDEELWVAKIAKTLNFELDNRGLYSVSNDWILRQILETDPSDFENALVLILWSHNERREMIINDEYFDVGWWVPYDKNYTVKQRIITEHYFRYFENELSNAMQFYRNVHHAQLYLRSLNVNYYMGITDSLDGFQPQQLSENNFACTRIDESVIFNKSYFDFYVKPNTLEGDAWHANKHGHAQYAEDFMQFMQL